jgi:acyl-coenzyme A thioesterase PaaI-like protein
MTLTSAEAGKLVETSVSFLERAGLRAPVMERGRVVAAMPIEGNTNHIGIMYAGALFSVAEVTGGAMFLTSFDTTRYYPVVKDMYIRFRRPATTDVSVEIKMDDGEIERIEREAAENRKADYALQGDIVDRNGEVVAVMKGTYQLRAMGI